MNLLEKIESVCDQITAGSPIVDDINGRYESCKFCFTTQRTQNKDVHAEDCPYILAQQIKKSLE